MEQDPSYTDIFQGFALKALNHFSLFSEWGAPKTPTEFKLFLDIAEGLFASCDSRMRGETQIFSISIGSEVPSTLASGLDLALEGHLEQYRLRVSWLIYHEVGHWVWAHNKFYAEYGWATDIGLSETHGPDRPIMGPLGLSHAAEICADSFAVQLLFEMLRVEYGNQLRDESQQISKPTHPDHTHERSVLQTRDCMLAIFLTVAVFYKHRLGRSASLLHPTWTVRALNLNRQMFESFLLEHFQNIAFEPGDKIDKDILQEAMNVFIDEICRPVIAIAQHISKELGFPEYFFPDDRLGLIDPQAMLSFMRKSPSGFSDVERLLQLSNQSRILVNYCIQHTPARDVRPNYAFGRSSMTDSHTLDLRTMTDLDETAAKAVIDEWSRTHRVEIVDFHYGTGVGIDEFATHTIDLVVRTLDALSPDQLKATLDYLNAALRYRSKKVDPEEE